LELAIRWLTQTPKEWVMTRGQVIPVRLMMDELREHALEHALTEDQALVELIFCYLSGNDECPGPDELFRGSCFAGFDRKRLDRLYPLAVAEWRQNERRV
jgi:hypothetical protein